jgi:hypothetical protein
VYEASAAKTQQRALIAPARLDDWNRLNTSFQAIAGSYSESVTDTSGTEPQRLSGLRVSPRYFAVFAAAPLLGRTFTMEEERDGGPLAAVLSYGLWTRRYGRDRNIIGRQLLIAGKAYMLVGVMPDGFAPNSVDLWVPAQTPPFILAMRDARFLNGVGRVRPGVSIEQARQEKLIGNTLEARVVLNSDSDVTEKIPKEELEEFFILSDLTIQQAKEASASVTRTPYKKCARCWRHRSTVGTSEAHPDLCDRCESVVVTMTKPE